MGRPITAASTFEAMAAALAEGDFLVTDDTNRVRLTNEQSVLVWSLRLDDENIQTEPDVP